MLRRLWCQGVRICQNHCSGQIHQTRTECVFRRMYPPRLRKEGEKRNLKRREYIYILEDNTTLRPAGNIEVILTTDIDELGNEGEIVKVSKRIAHNHLLPLGLGVYTSPDNLAKYEQKRKEFEGIRKQTKTGQATVRQLSAMILPIPMNPKSSWQLSSQHVRIAFRRAGVYLNENSIIMPGEPITSTGEIQIQVMVNELDKITVNAVLFDYNKDYDYLPDIEVWKDTRVELEDNIAQAYMRLHNNNNENQHRRVVVAHSS